MADSVLIDPLGRTITLHDRAWFGHIVRRHPELRDHRISAERAITDPLETRLSNADTDCRIYYGASSRPGIMTAVIADVVLGFVKTAYFTRQATGVLEWSRPTP